VSRFPFVTIGTILKPHGTAGELAVVSARCSSEFRCGMTVWVVPPVEDSRPLVIESVKQGAKGLIVKLSTVDCLKRSSALKGTSIMAASEELIRPEGDDFLSRLIGCKVFDGRLGEIGVIEEVIHTGANDVWIVDGEKWGQVLVPVIEDVVEDIDFDNGIVCVRLLDGLIDEEHFDAN